jgi:hypothetical protein
VKTNAIVCLAAIAFAAVSGPAHAQVTVKARAGVAAGNYSVSGDVLKSSGIPGTAVRPVEYRSDYVAVPVGITFIADSGLYFDLLYQSASGKAKFPWAATKPSFTRDETTMTIGAQFNRMSVYMGYKSGESNTDWPSPFSPDKFSSSGFLAGFAVGIPVGSGAINIGGGLGIINGRYNFSSSNANPFFLDSRTTLGFSLGGGYSRTFGKHLSLGGDLKYQSYNYKFSTAHLKENLSQVTVTIAYAF